jgi:hypothetical protein
MSGSLVSGWKIFNTKVTKDTKEEKCVFAVPDTSGYCDLYAGRVFCPDDSRTLDILMVPWPAFSKPAPGLQAKFPVFGVHQQAVEQVKPENRDEERIHQKR